MTQEIYISNWLEKDYKDVYNQLLKVLSEFGLTPKTLPYSKEVWCRDYMPIHIGEGKLLVLISDLIICGMNQSITNTSPSKNWQLRI